MMYKPNPLEIGSIYNKRPVFISSLYRSSSTFLAAVLSCHPRYFAMSSAVKFLRFCYAKYSPLINEHNQNAIILDTHKRIKTRWKIEFDKDITKSQVKKNGFNYASFYDAIMTSIMMKYDKNKIEWIEKIAIMWSKIPAFLDMFPNGKVIHVHRDPRNIMASYKKMTNEVGYTYLNTIFNFVDSVQSLNKFEKKYGKHKILQVKSEDIANNPKKILIKICNFLDVEFSNKMMDPNSNAFLLGESWSNNTSFRKEIIGFPKPHEKWKKYLTNSEILFLELISQPFLKKLKYESFDYEKDFNFEMFNDFLKDDYIRDLFFYYLKTGNGVEGYRTDPWKTEMKIVFPERFKK